MFLVLPLGQPRLFPSLVTSRFDSTFRLLIPLCLLLLLLDTTYSQVPESVVLGRLHRPVPDWLLVSRLIQGSTYTV